MKPSLLDSAREISALVPMPGLLDALGFAVNLRTRRSACILHGGSNPSAFSWTDAGLWRCHSCGAGGDRIALVRAARQYSFRQAIKFLAALAGVEFRPRRASRREIERRAQRRARAEHAAWRIADETGRLRHHYTDAIHRAERLCWHIGERGSHPLTPEEQDACWDALARLGHTQTFFLAAWNFFFSAPADALARSALASPGERRAIILTWEPTR